MSPNASSNGEWQCENIIPDIEVWGGANMKMDVIIYNYILQRVPHFYIYVIALPCLILTTLSIIGMFWRPNQKEEQIAKLGIGLTSLVSMTVLLQMVADAIPRTQDFPLLGIYVVVCIAIIGVACVLVLAYPEERSRLKNKDTENFCLK
ncbi:unnamed protein product, partial [Mesorhabditis spiculigera]